MSRNRRAQRQPSDMVSRYYSLIPLFAAIFNLVVGAAVLRSNPSARTNRVFTALALSLTFFNLNIFFFFVGAGQQFTFELTRYTRTANFLLPCLVLHLAMEIVDHGRSWRLVLIGSYAIALLLIGANLSDMIVSGLRSYRWGYYSVPTPLYKWVVIAYVADCIAAAVLLIRGFRMARSPRQRLIVKFWLLGAAAALPLGATNYLPVYGIEIVPLGNLGNVAFTGIIAYAMFRYRLMDFDAVLSKGIAYVVVSGLLLIPAFALLLDLQRRTFGKIDTDFSAVLLLILFVTGTVFPALRRRTEDRLKHSLFRQGTEFRNTLASFARKVVRILERDRLIVELGNALTRILQLDPVTIFLLDDRSEHYSPAYNSGPKRSGASLAKSNDLIRLAKTRRTILIRDELMATSDPTEKVVATICGENGWELCIPLIAGNRLIGLINLGRKRNLGTFSIEDLELLEMLAAEASVALENARLYEELKKSQDIIRRADRLSALGTLAAGIAHEVRNPLVSIQTFFQLAPDRLDDQEFFTTFLGMTANEVKRIANLITELLSFARSATPSLGPVDLNELVDRVATLLEPEARKHKLTFNRNLSSVAPIVHADGDQIKQVLINLVLNAIQATDAGGTVSIATRTVDHRNGAAGQLQVHDTGIGIPADRLEHIFDPFFTTKDKGTGLGLAIAHQIITEHGGSISVDSREGAGTTFVVNLPAYVAEMETSADTAPLLDADPVALRYTRARRVAS